MNCAVAFATFSCLLVLGPTTHAETFQRFVWKDVNFGHIRSMTLTGDDWKLLHNGLGTDQYPTGIAIDQVHSEMYWTQGPAAPVALRRINLYGEQREDLIPRMSPTDALISVAVDPLGVGSSGVPKVYFGEMDTGWIRRANLNGTGVETIAQGGVAAYVRPLDIDVDSAGGRLFWASYIDNTARQRGIVGSQLDGSGKAVLADNVPAIALSYNPSDDMLYWLTSDSNQTGGFNGAIERMNSHGGPIQTLVSLTNVPSIFRSLAIDNERGKLYWSDSRGIFSAGLDGSNVMKILDIQAEQLSLIVPEPSTIVSLGIAFAVMGILRAKRRLG
jgi:hypothetical protein